MIIIVITHDYQIRIPVIQKKNNRLKQFFIKGNIVLATLWRRRYNI